jgi:hypothetical protein
MDPEKNIPAMFFEKIQDYAGRFLTQTQHLDLLMLYLRKVHSYCFYCGEEYDDERTLAAKCGPQHLRNVSKTGVSLSQQTSSYQEHYSRAARERIERGVKEVLPPSEDNLLTQMKQEYVDRKTI